MLLVIFQSFTAQIYPNFVALRNIFEARERPAKIYSWQAFMLVSIMAECVWNSLVAVLMFLCWYYPIGLYRNAVPTRAVAERGGLMFLSIWSYMLFASTFAHMLIAGIEYAEPASFIGALLYALSLIFCGILMAPNALPGFWIFMYRVSPFTYLASSMVSAALGNTDVVCSDTELLRIPAPAGSTCEQYLGPFLGFEGGYLQNSGSNSTCLICPVSHTNAFISRFGIHFQDRWRNLGLVFVYVAFNAVTALGIYCLARVPHQRKKALVAPGEVGAPMST